MFSKLKSHYKMMSRQYDLKKVAMIDLSCWVAILFIAFSFFDTGFSRFLFILIAIILEVVFSPILLKKVQHWARK